MLPAGSTGGSPRRLWLPPLASTAVGDRRRYPRPQETTAGRLSLTRWRPRGGCARQVHSHRHHAALFRLERASRLQDSSFMTEVRAASGGGTGAYARWWICAALAVAPREGAEAATRLVRPLATPLWPQVADGCGWGVRPCWVEAVLAWGWQQQGWVGRRARNANFAQI